MPRQLQDRKELDRIRAIIPTCMSICDPAMARALGSTRKVLRRPSSFFPHHPSTSSATAVPLQCAPLNQPSLNLTTIRRFGYVSLVGLLLLSLDFMLSCLYPPCHFTSTWIRWHAFGLYSGWWVMHSYNHSLICTYIGLRLTEFCRWGASPTVPSLIMGFHRRYTVLILCLHFSSSNFQLAWLDLYSLVPPTLHDDLGQSWNCSSYLPILSHIHGLDMPRTLDHTNPRSRRSRLRLDLILSSLEVSFGIHLLACCAVLLSQSSPAPPCFVSGYFRW